MIRQIAPQFFTTDLPRTLAYDRDTLGFECVGTWQDPPVYAIVERDQQKIHFRHAEPPAPNPGKYADELLDAYLFIEDADVLYAEYASRGVEFTRALANTAWRAREFVVKDCDGRLLAVGDDLRVEALLSEGWPSADAGSLNQSPVVHEPAGTRPHRYLRERSLGHQDSNGQFGQFFGTPPFDSRSGRAGRTCRRGRRTAPWKRSCPRQSAATPGSELRQSARWSSST
jgi:hypothetical protein